MPFWNRPRLPDSIVLPPLWRRHASTSLVLAVVATGIVCARSVDRSRLAPTTGGDTDRYHDKTFRVARVVDGDTLDIQVADRDKPVTRIRLWGVDTPEVAGTRAGGQADGGARPRGGTPDQGRAARYHASQKCRSLNPRIKLKPLLRQGL